MLCAVLSLLDVAYEITLSCFLTGMFLGLKHGEDSCGEGKIGIGYTLGSGDILRPTFLNYELLCLSIWSKLVYRNLGNVRC